MSAKSAITCVWKDAEKKVDILPASHSRISKAKMDIRIEIKALAICSRVPLPVKTSKNFLKYIGIIAFIVDPATTEKRTVYPQNLYLFMCSRYMLKVFLVFSSMIIIV